MRARGQKSEVRSQRSDGRDRRGVALLAAMIALVILTSMLAAIAWQITANRRVNLHRENELEATWLARSGIEHAAARLLADPAGFSDEEIELMPRATVQISVIREAGATDVFRVTSEALYLASSREPIVRTETRWFRRIADGETVRLEYVEINGP